MREPAGRWLRVSTGGQDEANQIPDIDEWCAGHEAVEGAGGHGDHRVAIRRSTVDGDTGIARRALEPLAAALTKPVPAM